MYCVFYDIATGMIEPGYTMFNLEENIDLNLTPKRGVWTGILDYKTVYIVNGRPTPRPTLVPETAAAPLTIDCSVTGGEVLFRNEAGEEAIETDEMILTDPGIYTIIPPIPWQEQTLVLT